jgi:hypothetical protein
LVGVAQSMGGLAGAVEDQRCLFDGCDGCRPRPLADDRDAIVDEHGWRVREKQRGCIHVDGAAAI